VAAVDCELVVSVAVVTEAEVGEDVVTDACKPVVVVTEAEEVVADSCEPLPAVTPCKQAEVSRGIWVYCKIVTVVLCDPKPGMVTVKSPFIPNPMEFVRWSNLTAREITPSTAWIVVVSTIVWFRKTVLEGL